jgi:hypothetical protein
MIKEKSLVGVTSLLGHPWSFIRICAISILFFVSVVLIQPEAVFERSQSYDMMANIATETQWSIALFLIACFYTYTLCASHKTLSIVGGLFSFAALSTISLCFFLSAGLFTPGGALFGAMAMQTLVATFNSAFNWHVV